jgi:hypothetical protein
LRSIAPSNLRLVVVLPVGYPALAVVVCGGEEAVVGGGHWRIAAFVALSACGIPREEFVVEYTNHLCAHKLTCGNQADLTFDGILTVEDCVEREQSFVGEWGLGCRFRAGDAVTCLEDMAALTCPAGDGQLADVPLSCTPVYSDCDPSVVDSPPEEETDVVQ